MSPATYKKLVIDVKRTVHGQCAAPLVVGPATFNYSAPYIEAARTDGVNRTSIHLYTNPMLALNKNWCLNEQTRHYVYCGANPGNPPTVAGSTWSGLWITEFGVPGVDNFREMQGRLIADSYRAMAGKNVAVGFLYTLSEMGGLYSLIDGDGSPRPGFAAYTACAKNTGGCPATVQPTGSVDVGDMPLPPHNSPAAAAPADNPPPANMGHVPGNASNPCCKGGIDNFCQLSPGTAGCSMTHPGGYCDANQNGTFDDADWGRGYNEYQAQCQ